MNANGDSYYSPDHKGESTYRDKASKFISLVFPVSTEAEAREALAEVKKRFFDASHHCYAYCIGAGREVFRFNDDGEPSGSAGRPIYGQILSKGLSDTLVVVIRYFGGTKLGIPGLIRAYRTAASEALENSGRKEKILLKNISVRFGYEHMNEVMKISKAEKLEIISQESGDNCKMAFRVKASREEIVTARFRRISNIYISVNV
jgi:uncharacterized YigZ family protein